jgi:hypothetical protein
MDGQADAAGYLEYPNGMTIYAAVRAGILYVATWSPGGNGGSTNDHFIFITDQLLSSAIAPAPWGKVGNVAMAANKPFLGGESATSYCGWFNSPASAQVAKSPTNSGQMEGTIDLTAAFGSIPATIYVAAAAYQTADGGALAGQGPIGNGDGNIDPSEFLALSLVAITDENADGKFDRLDPALGFVVVQITSGNGTTGVDWNSVPGKTYQLEYCNQLDGQWFSLNAPLTAGPGEVFLSRDDSSAVSPRFYRVRLTSP